MSLPPADPQIGWLTLWRTFLSGVAVVQSASRGFRMLMISPAD